MFLNFLAADHTKDVRKLVHSIDFGKLLEEFDQRPIKSNGDVPPEVGKIHEAVQVGAFYSVFCRRQFH